MSWRGELAGHRGTLLLEEVDEDEHVARFRFQGTRDGATATATLIVTAAGEITAEVHPGHGSELTAEQLVEAARAVWPGAETRRRRALVAAGAAAALTDWARKEGR
jgi:hypothetical protein